MDIIGPGATSTAGAVWTNPTRTLTGLGGNALSFFNVTKNSIPANGSATYQPTPTQGAFLTLAIQSGAAGASNGILFDGSNSSTILSAAAGNNAGGSFAVTNGNYLKVFNGDAANAMFYAVAAVVFKQ
jgi:hypothetical protein